MRLEVTDLRTVTDDNPIVRQLEFRSGVVTLGSHSDSLVQIPDVDVAAHHATIERGGEAWVYKPKTRDDRQSRLNDKPVGGDAELKDGDVLVITHFEIRIHIEPEGGEVEATQVGRLGELAQIKKYPIPPRSTVRRPGEDVRLAPERQKALARFVDDLRACRDLSGLMETTLKTLETELSARMVWMGVRTSPDGPLELVDGRLEGAASMAEPPKLPTYAYRCLTRHQHITIPRTGDGTTQSVLAVPILDGDNAIGLLYVDSRRRERIYDGADLDFVSLVAGLIRAPLQAMAQDAPGLALSAGNPGAAEAPAEPLTAAPGDVSPLIRAFRERIQPRKLPQWPTLQIAHHAAHGAEQAGDVLDVVRMPNGLVAVLCAHVKADPTRTAMAVAQIGGAFRVGTLHADPPRVMLRALNWLISDPDHPCAVDATIAVINPKSGAFEISTAGRTGAFLITSSAAKSLVFADAPPIGNGKVVEYQGRTAKLSQGDSLALFTAGLINAKSADGEALGTKRLLKALSDNVGQDAPQAIEDLVTDLAEFLSSDAPPEDATIVLAHRPR